MQSSWSNSGRLTDVGVDLHLALEPTGRPRSALERALRDAIRTGRLAPGTRLPATRALAADLGLARGTVSAAYDQLAAEGYLRPRVGSGTVVALSAHQLRHQRPPRTVRLCRTWRYAACGCGDAGGAGRGRVLFGITSPSVLASLILKGR